MIVITVVIAIHTYIYMSPIATRCREAMTTLVKRGVIIDSSIFLKVQGLQKKKGTLEKIE